MLKIIKKAEKFYKVTIVLVDLALINLAYLLAFLIKFNGALPERNFIAYMESAPLLTIAALVYFDIFGILKFYRKSFYDSIIPIISAVALLSVTTVSIAYFNQGYAFPRSILALAPLLQVTLLLIWNWCIFLIKNLVTSQIKVMLVGYKEETETFYEKIRNSPNQMVKYVFLPEDIKPLLRRAKDVDEVLICPGVPDNVKMEIISYCIAQKKIVYVVPELFEISLLNAKLIQFEDVPAFLIDSLELSVEQRFFKRLFDIVVASIGLVLAIPIFAVVVPLIRLSSSGKAIYSQSRVTKNNKVFKIYKFRTMYENAEQTTGPVISSEDDPRITPVGNILRKLRLDEVPQIFNVLAGDMSIIGPRPERPYFVEQFAKDIPEYSYRNVVKAGITGYAQILGKYDTSPEDKLRYDLMYIKNYSLLLDIKLVFQTIKVLFMGKNMFKKSYSKSIETKSKVVNF